MHPTVEHRPVVARGRGVALAKPVCDVPAVAHVLADDTAHVVRPHCRAARLRCGACGRNSARRSGLGVRSAEQRPRREPASLRCRLMASVAGRHDQRRRSRHRGWPSGRRVRSECGPPAVERLCRRGGAGRRGRHTRSHAGGARHRQLSRWLEMCMLRGHGRGSARRVDCRPAPEHRPG